MISTAAARGSGAAVRLICADAALAAMDRRLTAVYVQAREKARHEHPPRLRTERRGWIKGRDDCWKAADWRACVVEAFTQRTAGL